MKLHILVQKKSAVFLGTSDLEPKETPILALLIVGESLTPSLLTATI